MPKRTTKQNRLSGLRGKLARQKRDADSLAKRKLFIERDSIRQTEHQIAMLKQEMAAPAAEN